MLKFNKSKLASRWPLLSAIGVTMLFSAVACAGETTAAPSVDTALPEMSIVSPEKGATPEGPVTLEVEATDNREVAEVRYWLDGSGPQPLTFNEESDVYVAEIPTQDLYRGKHKITVDVEDDRGNVARETVSIMIEKPSQAAMTETAKAKPSISLVMSEIRAVSPEGPVMLVIEAPDNQKLVGLGYSVDGAAFQPLAVNAETGMYEARIVTENLSSGTYTVTISAQDAEGNVSRETINIIVA